MVEIVNLGHACFLIKTEETTLLIDPYKDGSVPNLTMPIIKVNHVFTSHQHSDHNAIENVINLPSEHYLKYQTIQVPHDHHSGSKRGLNLIHIFYLDNLKILHLGDTGCVPDKNVLDQLKDADVILGPINGFFTISATEFAEIINYCKPKVFIPMHYHRSENNSGYPDGGQIKELKKLFPQYKEVNDFSIKIDDKSSYSGLVIFTKALQRGMNYD